MKRGCSLGDVACGVQRSVGFPVRVIQSRSATDVCRHAVCWSNLCLSNLSRHHKSSDRIALPLATDRATVYKAICQPELTYLIECMNTTKEQMHRMKSTQFNIITLSNVLVSVRDVTIRLYCKR